MYVNALQESDFFFFNTIYLSNIAVKEIELSSLYWRVKCKVYDNFIKPGICFYHFGWYIKLL